MIVIESSAMVDVLVADPVNPELVAAVSGQPLHAPALLDFEVASALRGRILGRKLEHSRLDTAIADFQGVDVRRHRMTRFLPQILDLRDNFTTYDAAYVVLAKVLNAPLITTDAKMKVAEKAGVEVRILRSGDM
ncbi:type II toxin-antitoxin system VapC family toxin [Sphaerisporangium viridialbum]|uniref:type II toxin-antitoxin system VapC family toxin n=1 Tax=Sphaerisporangium viridialbum TaxID=46189 RepID=UPI003C75679A